MTITEFFKISDLKDTNVRSLLCLLSNYIINIKSQFLKSNPITDKTTPKNELVIKQIIGVGYESNYTQKGEIIATSIAAKLHALYTVTWF